MGIKWKNVVYTDLEEKELQDLEGTKTNEYLNEEEKEKGEESNGYDEDSDEEENDNNLEKPWSKKNYRLMREMKGLRSYNNPGRSEITEFMFITVIASDDDEPETFKDAWWHKDSHEQEKWQEAIKKEFGDMVKRGVWEKIKIESVPKDKKLIGSKWVFKKKKNGIYRTRLVALGYSQIPGVDFFDNFAPVVNDVTLRIIVVMMIVNKWHAEIIDVETAFLYGDLQEEIYMKCPDGLDEYEEVENSGNCLRLKQTLYGLVQAAWAWWLKFVDSLKSKNFKRCPIDPCFMVSENEHGIAILCIYVDDVMCVGDEMAVKEAIRNIEGMYSIKRMGKLHEYVGVTIEKKKENMYVMSQPETIKKLKKKFVLEYENLREKKTPAASRDVVIRPTLEEEKIEKDEQDRYRSGVGMLLWLTKHSRSDIANCVREASKVMDGATLAHYKYMLCIVKYVVDTENLKLKINPNKVHEGEWHVKAFTDSDFSGDHETRKSVSGFIVYFMGAPIAWRSRGQKSVTLSSTEAEYVAVLEVAMEVVFVKNLLEFL
jgi:copper chaperone CopZ